MNTMGDTFRAKSREARAGADTLVGTPEFATDPKTQMLATVGYVRAVVLSDLADLVDYLRGAKGVDTAAERRKAIMERNDAIRKAAARRDWTEFDRLVESFGGSGGSSGGQEGGITAGGNQ